MRGWLECGPRRTASPRSTISPTEKSDMKTIALVVVACVGSLAPAHAETLKLAQTIPLAGVAGRFDHFSVDIANQRLFVAALGNNTAEVIDVGKSVRVQSIRDLRKPTGVLFLSDPGKLYIANGDDGTFRVFDGNSL